MTWRPQWLDVENGGVAIDAGREGRPMARKLKETRRAKRIRARKKRRHGR